MDRYSPPSSCAHRRGRTGVTDVTTPQPRPIRKLSHPIIRHLSHQHGRGPLTERRECRPHVGRCFCDAEAGSAVFRSHRPHSARYVSLAGAGQHRSAHDSPPLMSGRPSARVSAARCTTRRCRPPPRALIAPSEGQPPVVNAPLAPGRVPVSLLSLQAATRLVAFNWPAVGGVWPSVPHRRTQLPRSPVRSAGRAPAWAPWPPPPRSGRALRLACQCIRLLGAAGRARPGDEPPCCQAAPRLGSPFVIGMRDRRLLLGAARCRLCWLPSWCSPPGSPVSSCRDPSTTRWQLVTWSAWWDLGCDRRNATASTSWRGGRWSPCHRRALGSAHTCRAARRRPRGAAVLSCSHHAPYWDDLALLVPPGVVLHALAARPGAPAAWGPGRRGMDRHQRGGFRGHRQRCATLGV